MVRYDTVILLCTTRVRPLRFLAVGTRWAIMASTVTSQVSQWVAPFSVQNFE